MLHCLPLASRWLLAVISLADLPAVPTVASASGVVLTEQGAPLPGATVQLAGTPQLTITNAAGGFVLVLPEPAPQATRKVSCHGYRTTEASWYAGKPLRVVLKSNVGMGQGSPTPHPKPRPRRQQSPTGPQC